MGKFSVFRDFPADLNNLLWKYRKKIFRKLTRKEEENVVIHVPETQESSKKFCFTKISWLILGRMKE